MIKLQVEIEDVMIKDAKFKTFGCSFAIACSSLATEKIIGKSVDYAAKITNYWQNTLLIKFSNFFKKS